VALATPSPSRCPHPERSTSHVALGARRSVLTHDDALTPRAHSWRDVRRAAYSRPDKELGAPAEPAQSRNRRNSEGSPEVPLSLVDHPVIGAAIELAYKASDLSLSSSKRARRDLIHDFPPTREISVGEYRKLKNEARPGSD
jgi:hypothetical protein